jgi:hypothetical protein
VGYFFYFQKTGQSKQFPIGKNSPNLVTLEASLFVVSFSIQNETSFLSIVSECGLVEQPSNCYNLYEETWRIQKCTENFLPLKLLTSAFQIPFSDATKGCVSEILSSQCV